nr:uncharacterized protein LOC115258179 [Aedes albopictus]
MAAAAERIPCLSDERYNQGHNLVVQRQTRSVYEDIIKYSRNINIERNRIIFLLDPEDVEHFHRFHSPTPIRKPSTREIRCAAFLKCAALKVDLLDVKMMELPRISNDQAALHMSHESGSVGGIRIHQTSGTSGAIARSIALRNMYLHGLI